MAWSGAWPELRGVVWRRGRTGVWPVPRGEVSSVVELWLRGRARAQRCGLWSGLKGLVWGGLGLGPGAWGWGQGSLSIVVRSGVELELGLEPELRSMTYSI